MALTAIQKEAFLRRINEIPIEFLKNKIDNNELTLDECIEHGLDSSKIEQLSLLEIEEEQQQQQFEEDSEFYTSINNDEVIIQEIQRSIFEGRVTEEGLL